jgi:hypothetical protein
MSHDPHKPTVAFDEQPDSWHMHAAEEGLPQEEHGATTNPIGLILAFAGSVFFVGSVILMCVLYYRVHTTQLRQQRIETTALAGDYFKYRDDSTAAQGGYGWAGPEAAAAGQVSIPVDLAMQKVIQQYASGSK